MAVVATAMAAEADTLWAAAAVAMAVAEAAALAAVVALAPVRAAEVSCGRCGIPYSHCTPATSKRATSPSSWSHTSLDTARRPATEAAATATAVGAVVVLASGSPAP